MPRDQPTIKEFISLLCDHLIETGQTDVEYRPMLWYRVLNAKDKRLRTPQQVSILLYNTSTHIRKVNTTSKVSVLPVSSGFRRKWRVRLRKPAR